MIIRPPSNAHPFNFPDYIAEALKEFKNMVTSGTTFQDIINEYRRTFVSIPTYRVQVKKDTILFRARKNEGKDEDLFKAVSDVGIVPDKYVKSFGRAHIPGHPAFYCSTNEETVVREATQWYINDTGRAQDLITKGIMGMGWSPFTSMMTISAWRVKEDLTLALLFNGDPEKRTPAIQQIEKERMTLDGADNENYRRSENLIIDFFSTEYGKLDVKHEYDYLFSAYYAYEVYKEVNRADPSLKLDGVKYASIANDLRGENIAICKDSFLKKIEFLGANYCYTYNSNNRDIANAGSCIIGRDKSALLLDDGTFRWVDSSNDVDYLVRHGNGIHPLILEQKGPVWPRVIIG